MKIRKPLPTSIGLAALAATAALIVFPVLAVERLDYAVLEVFDAFELRRYDAHLQATATTDSTFERAGNQAFRPLFNYIDGRNTASQKIAMTAPVTQTPTADGYEIGFVMPQNMTAADLPAPTSSEVRLVERSGSLMAARRYTGGWRESLYRREEQALLAAITETGLSVCGPATWARFDPPFMPSFWRTNEILVPVSREGCASAG